MTTRTILAALLALNFVPLAACSGADVADELEEEAPIDGKLDSFRAPTDNGILPFAEVGDGEIGDDHKYHTWSFELTRDASVTIETRRHASSEASIDTVLYLYEQGAHGAWGSYIERDDDNGDGKFAKLEDLALEAGTYRLLVKGKRTTTRGLFEVEVQCSGAGCMPASPPTSPTCDVYAGAAARTAYRVALENDALTDVERIAPEDLPPGPFGVYDHWVRDLHGDYTPSAFYLPFANPAHGSFIAVELIVDQEVYVSLFDAAGFFLGEGSASEDGQLEWSEDPCFVDAVKGLIVRYVESGDAVEGVGEIPREELSDRAQDDIDRVLTRYGRDAEVAYLELRSGSALAHAMVVKKAAGDTTVRLFDEQGHAVVMAYTFGAELVWTTDLRLRT